jgi:hypothetical protein
VNTTNSSISSSTSTPSFNYVIDHAALGIPHHPLQYRAIGVIQGVYHPLENILTKGTMTTLDGQEFETVLLGKTISAVKNHIDLAQVQNWVVYPHTIPDTDDIHFQIAGIYIPSDNFDYPLPRNYFSIRGEVLYSSKYKQKIIVKILDNNFVSRKKARSFKLELKGRIPDNHIKHFFSFSACLQEKKIVVQQYIDLGLIAVNS